MANQLDELNPEVREEGVDTNVIVKKIPAKVGFGSTLFAAVFTMAAVVMYDASGVRRETGLQAQIINDILRKVFVTGEPISDVELKELIGHTKMEVAGGFLVGILTALAYILM